MIYLSLSEQEILLIDRIMINKQISDTFVENIKERLSYGINHMNLEMESIEPLFCSTINKHTCTETLSSQPNKFYLIFDEHHFDLICAMNFLFYLFGKDNLTAPIFSAMHMVINASNKRLRFIAALLLSEKCLLSSNATQAKAYLDELSKNNPSFNDFQGKTGDFALNLFLLKERRASYTNSLIMTYYVFHELAHIAYYHNSDALRIFKLSLKSIFPKLEHFTPSLEEEIVCDAYALNIMFDFLYMTDHDFGYDDMVKSFISAIISLTFMDSVIAHGNDIENWYIICWKRIIITLQLVGYQKEMYEGHINFSSHIQDCLQYCRMTYLNYKNELQNVIIELQNKYSNISEQFPIFSNAWINEKDSVLQTIASIR